MYDVFSTPLNVSLPLPALLDNSENTIDRVFAGFCQGSQPSTVRWPQWTIQASNFLAWLPSFLVAGGATGPAPQVGASNPTSGPSSRILPSARLH